MTNKIDAYDMPLYREFLVTLRNITWAPGTNNTIGDEWFPKFCNIVVEVDRNSAVSEVVRAAKVAAAKKYGAGVLSADATIDPRDHPAFDAHPPELDLDDTLEFEEVY